MDQDLASSDLLASLQQLRRHGEHCRAELYWTIQRLRRARRRSRELIDSISLRQTIRIHRHGNDSPDANDHLAAVG